MGSIAVQLAKELGCTVLAVVSTHDKADFCRKLGADQVCVLDADKKRWGAQLKDLVAPYNGGVDVVYEVVGGDVFHACSRVMRGGGRLLVVGFAADEIPTLKMNLPLIKGYSVVGVRSGAEFMLHPELLEECAIALQKSSFIPHFEVFPLARVPEAFRILAERKAKGKLVIDIESGVAKAGTNKSKL